MTFAITKEQAPFLVDSDGFKMPGIKMAQILLSLSLSLSLSYPLFLLVILQEVISAFNCGRVSETNNPIRFIWRTGGVFHFLKPVTEGLHIKLCSDFIIGGFSNVQKTNL